MPETVWLKGIAENRWKGEKLESQQYHKYFQILESLEKLNPSLCFQVEERATNKSMQIQTLEVY